MLLMISPLEGLKVHQR